MIVIRPNGLADLDLDRAIARHVAFVLDYCTVEDAPNIEWAAQELGVNQTTLRRWIRAGMCGLKVAGREN